MHQIKITSFVTVARRGGCFTLNEIIDNHKNLPLFQLTRAKQG